MTSCAGCGDGPPGLGPGAELDAEIVQLAEAVEVADLPASLRREALQAALFRAGFQLRDNGIAFGDSDRPQGLIFEVADLDLIAAAMDAGIAQTLDDWAGVLAEAVTATEGADGSGYRAALLEDLARGAAAAEDSPQRAFAQLVVALGRAGGGYDLLDPDVAGTAPLDSFQLALLTWRFSGEVWVSAQPEGQSLQQGLEGEPPCTQTEAQGLIGDAQAVTSGLVLGHVLEKLEEAGVAGADKLSARMNIANVALSYLKLAWTMAVFKVEMSVVDPPLPRTLTRAPGDRRDVTARFSLDGTGRGQVINCLRSAFNAMNLDFTLPQDGPLAGTRVEWEVIAPKPHDVVQTVSGDILRDETDSTGLATLTVEGKPQKEDLTGKAVIEVERRPRVRATTNLKNKNMVQDLIDAGAGAGGLGALWTLPVEILNRKPLLFSGSIGVPVLDHKRLEGDHFRITGEYADPLGSAARNNQKLDQVTDSFVADLEVKIIDGEVHTELLRWTDGRTSARDTYEQTFVDGEGCTATQTPNGVYEVFTSLRGDQIEGAYFEGSGGAATVAIQMTGAGYTSYRGFHIENDEPSCPDSDTPATTERVYLPLGFDSTQLRDVGDTVTLDQRSNGVGWLLTVRYEQ